MFQSFPKIARLSRECIVTEKIDGTNAQILILDPADPTHSILLENMVPTYTIAAKEVADEKGVRSLLMFAGSRTRFITPQNDNYGFAGWVSRNAEELFQLGPGRHFGEWWGSGIQRTYGLTGSDKRFSLFNTTRWCAHGEEPKTFPGVDPRVLHTQEVLPPIVGVVPELYRGTFDTEMIEATLSALRLFGSKAAPGYDRPEGVVVYHSAAGVGFKKTLERDEQPKGQK